MASGGAIAGVGKSNTAKDIEQRVGGVNSISGSRFELTYILDE
jgi:hypothetical protein